MQVASFEEARKFLVVGKKPVRYRIKNGNNVLKKNFKIFLKIPSVKQPTSYVGSMIIVLPLFMDFLAQVDSGKCNRHNLCL